MKMKMIAFAAVAVFLQLSQAFGQITIDPPTRSVPKEGGGYSILTAGSGTWTASTPAGWITITPRTNGTAGESCIYVVSANFSADTRQAIISIGGNTHTVTQTGYDATLSPQSATYGIAGGTGSVSVSTTAGVSWSAASTTSWITVFTTNGISNGTVSYSVAPYGGVVTRVGSIIIGSKTFLITQTGTDVNISPSAVDKAYSSDIIMVNVTALVGTLWTVVPNNPWITVVDAGNGFGDSVITLAIGTNPSYAPRAGTVSIGSATFTIRQDGAMNPSLDITPYASTANPNGALGNIAVSATPDSPWTAQSQAGWIIIASGTNGSGNGNINYVVSANPTITTRVGTVLVTGPSPNDSNNDFARGLMHCYRGRTNVVSFDGLVQGVNYPDFNGTTTAVPFSDPAQAVWKDSDEWSIAFSLRHAQNGTVHRLLYYGTKLGIWVDGDNHLNMKVNSQTSTVSTLEFMANTNYFVVLQGGTNSVELYACEFGGTPLLRATAAVAGSLFPVNTDFSALTMGGGNYPSAGFYTGRFELKSIHARKLTASEIEGYRQSDPWTIGTTDVARSFWLARGVTTIKPLRNVLFRGSARDENGTGNPKINGKYVLVPTAMSWTAAKADAISRGGQLAIILSAEDNALAQAAAGNGNAWLGGTDEAVEGTWKWVNGATFTYANWGTGEPNNTGGVEDYLHIGAVGKWNDSSNPGPFPYILQNGAGALTLTRDRFARCSGAMVRTNSINLSYLGSSFRTAIFWVKQDGTTGGTIATFRAPSASGDNHIAFGIDASTRKLYLEQDNGAKQMFDQMFNPGQWRQIGISLSSSYNIKVLVDGAEVGNVLPYRSLSGIFTDFGTWTWKVSTLSGAFDDLALYTEELTPAEMLGLYNVQKPIWRIHTVTQGALPVSMTPAQSVISADGGTADLNLSLGGNVSWTTSVSAAWLSLNTNSGAGPATIVVQAAANGAVTSRTGSVTAGGQTVQIVQQGRWASVSTNSAVIGPDGGSLFFDVSVEGAATWTAVSGSSWLTVALGASGSGNGSVMVVADPYNEYSRARIGSVLIAGQTVYVSQCGYALTVNPTAVEIGSNAGAGELAIVAPLDAVWEAVVTAPWITLVGGNNGIGSGTLRYSVAANNTGEIRTGRIIISGVQYTIVQGINPTDNDEDGMPNEWELLYGFNINDPSDAYDDPDGDGLPNLQECQIGTNPLLRDTSGDGVDDGTAYALRSLGFSPTNDSSSLAQQIQENSGGLGIPSADSVLNDPNAYDLYTASQMHGLALGDLVIDRNPGNNRFRIGFGLQSSSNMLDWVPMPDQNISVSVSNGLINTEVTTDTNAWFFRVRSGTQP